MSDILKNKFSEYEVQPPAEVWNKITIELEASNSFKPLSEKMYGFEVEPPIETWSAINTRLHNQEATPVKNLRPLLLKFAAAAVVIGLILVSSIFLFQKELVQSPVAKLPVPSIPHVTPDNTPGNGGVVQPPVAVSLPTISLRRNSNNNNNPADHSLARVSVRERRRPLTAAAVAPRYLDMSPEMNDIIVKGGLIRNERGDIIQDPHVLTSGDDEYISVTGPNGQQTKISSKFAGVLLYLNANPTEQDAEWQRKFQDWRAKIMQTSFIPSSSNFLDILELKDFILKDNQQ